MIPFSGFDYVVDGMGNRGAEKLSLDHCGCRHYKGVEHAKSPVEPAAIATTDSLRH